MAMQDTRVGLGGGQEKPLYGGTRNEAQSRGRGGLSVLHGMGESYAPAQRALETANRNLMNAGNALPEAMRQRLDWTLQQQRQEQAKSIAAAAQLELNTRLNLQDGVAGSFFNEDHTFNEKELKSFTKTYGDQIKGWEKGFLTPEYQNNALESMTDMKAGLQAQIGAAIGKATFTRANTLLMKGFSERLDLADFDGAMAFAVEGLRNGGAHLADMPKLRARAGRARILHKAKAGASDNEVPFVNTSEDSFTD